MSPSDIEVLIHCHVSPDPHPRKDASAVHEALRNMAIGGLLKQNAVGIYETTDKGKAHIKQLCLLPLPTKAWLNGEGEVIAP